MTKTPGTADSAFIYTLQELHATEQCLQDALITWHDRATGHARDLIALHLDHTRTQAERVSELLDHLGAPPRPVTCVTVQDLLREARTAMEAGSPCDLALLWVERRMAMYQVLMYEGARRHAQRVQDEMAASTLQLALAEERCVEHLTQYLHGRERHAHMQA